MSSLVWPYSVVTWRARSGSSHRSGRSTSGSSSAWRARKARGPGSARLPPADGRARPARPRSPSRQLRPSAQRPWQNLNFLPLPHEHGSLRPTLVSGPRAPPATGGAARPGSWPGSAGRLPRPAIPATGAGRGGARRAALRAGRWSGAGVPARCRPGWVPPRRWPPGPRRPERGLQGRERRRRRGPRSGRAGRPRSCPGPPGRVPRWPPGPPGPPRHALHALDRVVVGGLVLGCPRSGCGAASMWTWACIT